MCGCEDTIDVPLPEELTGLIRIEAKLDYIIQYLERIGPLVDSFTEMATAMQGQGIMGMMKVLSGGMSNGSPK
jgi:hypothetical protein